MHIGIQVCSQTCMGIHVCNVCPLIHILDTYLYAHILVCMDAHTYEYMYLCIYACTYTHYIHPCKITCVCIYAYMSQDELFELVNLGISHLVMFSGKTFHYSIPMTSPVTSLMTLLLLSKAI